MQIKINLIIYNRLYLFISVLFLTACQGNKEIRKEENKKLLVGFVNETDVGIDYYRSIKSNVARLQAFMAGKFVQQDIVYLDSFLDSLKNIVNAEAENTSITKLTQGMYSTWLVNDNNDSVVLYSFPVGDPRKVGYWLYHYQVLTSLPDDPIYEVFEELIEIDRDTIESYFYASPKDFDPSLKELLKNYTAEFKSINLRKLKQLEDKERPIENGKFYLRQNPIFFKSETYVTNHSLDSPVCEKDIYELHPKYYYYHTIAYTDSTRKTVAGVYPGRFLKEGAFIDKSLR